MSERNCPKCHTRNVTVVESHSTFRGQAKRIRRRCSSCRHAWTIYEIDQETVDKYKALQQKFDYLRNYLFAEGNVLDCHGCHQWVDGECSLDIPEAGGSFASECSYYFKA